MRHGWFEVAGLQTGEHTVKNRLHALPTILRERAKGATILDLGCAEGLLGTWLLDNCGAALVHGVDIEEPFLERGRELAGERNATFFRADLNYLDVWIGENPGVLLPQYDIVLALCIAKKMAQPERFLRTAASLCGDILAIETPEPVIVDSRSAFRPVDIAEFLSSCGFDCIQKPEVGPFRALFRRGHA
jgi:2-polyprenyl-3-methyl-5-hydroxy-6-metoxy-1,4-benzoquinol methylase